MSEITGSRTKIIGAAQVVILITALVLVGYSIMFGTLFFGRDVVTWIVASLLVSAACVGRGGPVGWLWMLWGLMAFCMVRNLADDISPFGIHSQDLRQLESFLFAGRVPSLELQRMFFVPGRVGWLEVGSWLVYASYFFAPYVAGFILWLSRPWQLRGFAHVYVLTLLLASVLHIIVPAAPPWLVPGLDGTPDVYKVVSFVGNVVTPETYKTVYENLGDQNPVAAMPSVHYAVTFLVFLLTVDKSKVLTVLGVIYCLAMLWTLVYFGEHYVIDCAVGAGLAWGVWRSYGRLTQHSVVKQVA